MGELGGQVAIVTGGASGIGAAAARAIADAGASVAILDRDADGAGRVAQELADAGHTARAVPIDLAETERIPAAVRDVLGAFGRIDILVNAAAIGGDSGPITDVVEKTWDAIYAVNLRAPLLLMQEVSRHMIERGGGGRIVNISSSSAFRARGSPMAYSSSKAALVQVTRVVAAELARHDINVNAVAPGITATGMTQAMGEEGLAQATREGPLANLFQRVSQPDDVAAAILFLCLPSSRQVTAQTIHTSAGAVIN